MLFIPRADAYHRAFVQVPRSAFRWRATVLRDMAALHPAFRDRCLRYQQLLLFNQASQSAACNPRHDLSQHLARWLLMTRDRFDSNDITMTQEFMAHDGF